MDISFAANILMIGLFLVLSPTAPVRFSLTGLVQSLPVIGIPFRARVRLRPGGRVCRQAERGWFTMVNVPMAKTTHAI